MTQHLTGADRSSKHNNAAIKESKELAVLLRAEDPLVAASGYNIKERRNWRYGARHRLCNGHIAAVEASKLTPLVLVTPGALRALESAYLISVPRGASRPRDENVHGARGVAFQNKSVTWRRPVGDVWRRIWFQPQFGLARRSISAAHRR